MTKAEIPILKIGAVIIRESDDAVLIIQPIPKHEDEIPQYVLPRGTRQYAVVVNGETEWHDARDAQTGVKYAETLEPFYRGLEREIEEEAGITREQLRSSRVIEMAGRDFSSNKKGIYPIHWYVVMPDKQTCEGLMKQKPSDALETKWLSLADIKKLAKEDKFSKGYVPVIEEALRATRSTRAQSHHGAAAPGQ